MTAQDSAVAPWAPTVGSWSMSLGVPGHFTVVVITDAITFYDRLATSIARRGYRAFVVSPASAPSFYQSMQIDLIVIMSDVGTDPIQGLDKIPRLEAATTDAEELARLIDQRLAPRA
ncbi:MAG: hypothetical protein WKG01_11390 [Kofleriaceae bacterium]